MRGYHHYRRARRRRQAYAARYRQDEMRRANWSRYGKPAITGGTASNLLASGILTIGSAGDGQPQGMMFTIPWFLVTIGVMILRFRRKRMHKLGGGR